MINIKSTKQRFKSVRTNVSTNTIYSDIYQTLIILSGQVSICADQHQKCLEKCQLLLITISCSKNMHNKRCTNELLPTHMWWESSSVMAPYYVKVVLEQSTKRRCYWINCFLLWPPWQHRLLRQQGVNTVSKHNMKHDGCFLVHAGFGQVIIAMVDPIESHKTVNHQK